MQKTISLIILLLISRPVYAGIEMSFRKSDLYSVEIKVKSFETYFWNNSGVDYRYIDSVINQINKIDSSKVRKRLDILKTLSIRYKQAHIDREFEQSNVLAREIVKEFEKIKAEYAVGSMFYSSSTPEKEE